MRALLGTLFLLAALCPMTAFSVAPRLSMGLGLAASQYMYEAKTMWNPEAVDHGIRLGPAVSLTVLLPWPAPLNLESGLIYDRKGGNVTLPENWNSGPRSTIRYKLDYLSVPTYARLPFGGGEYLKLGMELGFLLSARDQYGKLEKGDYRAVDPAIAAGVGYTRRIGDHAAFIDVTYAHGLIDIIDPPPPLLFEAKSHNREARLSLGLIQ